MAFHTRLQTPYPEKARRTATVPDRATAQTEMMARALKFIFFVNRAI
jgi:hypothetical protein